MTSEDEPQQPYTHRFCCQNWDEFVARVHAVTEPPTVWYRGHGSADEKISSHWERRLRELREAYGRDDDDPEWAGYESHVDRFIEAAGRAPQFDAVDFEARCTNRKLDPRLCWELLGRHHRLVSRALDWSTSPFVAAFFAFDGIHSEGVTTRFKDYKQPPDDEKIPMVCVWALTIDEEIQQLPETEFQRLDFTLDEFSPRQLAQEGVFTRLDHPKHLDLESYLVDKRLNDRLVQYRLPVHAVTKAREGLRVMNITHATLFPDIDGAAKWANQFGS